MEARPRDLLRKRRSSLARLALPVELTAFGDKAGRASISRPPSHPNWPAHHRRNPEGARAERRAPSGLVRAPVIKHDELEIGYAARFFHPQGRCNLYGVAKRHHSRLFVVASHAGHPLPFRVAKSRHSQHGVSIGRHQRRERSNVSRQLLKSVEAAGNEH